MWLRYSDKIGLCPNQNMTMHGHALVFNLVMHGQQIPFGIIDKTVYSSYQVTACRPYIIIISIDRHTDLEIGPIRLGYIACECTCAYVRDRVKRAASAQYLISFCFRFIFLSYSALAYSCIVNSGEMRPWVSGHLLHLPFLAFDISN